MLKVRKSYVLDENKRLCAVQVSIADFERMEETLENFGLAKLMDEPAKEKPLSLVDAKTYYRSLGKKNVAGYA